MLAVIAGRAQKWPLATHSSCKRWWELVLRLRLSQSSSQVSGSHQICLEPLPPPPQKICWWDSAEGVWSSRTHSKSAVLLEWVESIVWQFARKHPEKWQGGDWFFHHDNVPAHTTLSVQHFWLKTKWWLCSTTPAPYLPTSLLPTVFCTHIWRGFEREAFCWCCRGSMRITGGGVTLKGTKVSNLYKYFK